ncbi:MAG: DUF1553 domain-containing protein [Fimbriimonadaceae bacterium]|nr:DUF1553 domain-containing protein [Fimbriimonadaceae bacterium]
MIGRTRTRWWLALGSASPYVLLLASAGTVPREDPVDYARQVAPILKASCLGCHSGADAQGGLDLSTPTGVRKAVVPGAPERSSLVVRLDHPDKGKRMPLGFPALPKAQVETLAAWVRQGAKFETLLTWSDVAPIFKANCSSCHAGPSAKGGLDLASPAGIAKGGASGPAFVAGNPRASRILQRVRGEGGLTRMPMGFPPLSASQVRTIEAWIAGGASLAVGEARKHWAYVPPVRPKTPSLEDKTWPKQPLDAFVLAALEAKGWRPSPEADRPTLLRRLSFDLTGLPPSPEEIDAFVADRSPQAYEKVVDRLLASPAYGEKQARVWLDLGRYADTDGFEKDLGRTAWKYRDWLIAAFNRNLPFDQFTIEQIAGDLLPNPSVDQLLATGFHRNSMLNLEGGVDQEEAHFNVVLDRVSTTATVWLGSTLACARCHDHKYDPFSQKDFYRMAAFFSNSKIYPRGPKEVSEEKWYEAEMDAPTPEQATRRQALRAQVGTLRAKLDYFDPATRAAYERWKADGPRETDWTLLVPSSVTSAEGAAAEVSADGTVRIGGPNPKNDTTKAVGKVKGPARLTGLRLEVLTDPSLPGTGPGRSDNGNFVLTGVQVEVAGKPVALREAVADYSQMGFSANAAVRPGTGEGWAVAQQTGRSHWLIAEFVEPIVTPVSTDLVVTLEQRSKYDRHNLGRFRVALTGDPEPLLAAYPSEVRAAWARPDRIASDEARLRAHFASRSAATRDLRDRLAAAQRNLEELQRAIPTALVMRDKPAALPLQANVHERGEFLSKGELVRADTPVVLSPFGKRPGNRLGLAQWLVSKDNPLTARVQVNRMWEQLFGQGLVETAEDFGTQGSPPANPPLLDWLAVEFMDRGWDMKALLKTIVTSATYRQTSRATPAMLAADPANRLLARGPRVRLEAEAIRDAALRYGGLLNPKIGGPSVYPYQPEGTWNSPYSGEQWRTETGPDRYRRSLYTYWKRTAPYPMFMAFDATSREECTVRRIRTNTPLQALALLNDEGLLEAARGLARRMGSGDDAAKVARGFKICVGRAPLPEEIKRLTTLAARLRARYANEPVQARRVAGSEKATTEDAVWTLVANVLLNLDETLTKG